MLTLIGEYENVDKLFCDYCKIEICEGEFPIERRKYVYKIILTEEGGDRPEDDSSTICLEFCSIEHIKHFFNEHEKNLVKGWRKRFGG